MNAIAITPYQWDQRRRAGQSVELIDVRTPAEFREIHAETSRNIPLESLQPTTLMNDRNSSSDQPLYVICRTGSRARQACQRFEVAGFDNVVVVEGGVQAWEKAGLKVARGKKTISLERQVRVAAGFLTLLSALLATFVHPYFAALAAFVGGGLIYAGLTDTCGMGLMLAHMPWNQVRDLPSDS